MSASYETVKLVYKAVRRQVTDQQMECIIDELLQVPGNHSFRETIRRLAGEDAKTENHK